MTPEIKPLPHWVCVLAFACLLPVATDAAGFEPRSSQGLAVVRCRVALPQDGNGVLISPLAMSNVDDKRAVVVTCGWLSDRSIADLHHFELGVRNRGSLEAEVSCTASVCHAGGRVRYATRSITLSPFAHWGLLWWWGFEFGETVNSRPAYSVACVLPPRVELNHLDFVYGKTVDP